MPRSPSHTLSKISVRVFEPLFSHFQTYFDGAGRPSVLKRDAVLDWVLAGEVEYIRRDLQGKRLSPKGRQHIASAIKRAPYVPASFAIRTSTADALNALVAQHNLVRDSLMNWIMTLLSTGPSLLRALDLPTSVDEAKSGRTYLDGTSITVLDAIQEHLVDPFYYLRHACEERHGVGLYELPLPSTLTVLTCYLPDDNVPGTRAHSEASAHLKWLDELLDAGPALATPSSGSENDHA
jgi:hypothetical protein